MGRASRSDINLFQGSPDRVGLTSIARDNELSKRVSALEIGSGGAIISTGSGAPVSTPSAEGDVYVDTTNDDVYIAAGTASSADWKQATGAGGGDLLAANNLSDVANAATAFANIKQAATDSASGVLEIALSSEVDTGTDNTRAITPLALAGSQLQADVSANNAKVTNATHTGDVTGATALTIANNAVTLAKLADIATDSFLGRDTAGTGDPEVLTPAAARTILNVEDGADVTDATNVDAAGATMNTDASLAGNSYFLDEDAMTSNDATKVPSQQSVKAYVDSGTAALSNKDLTATTNKLRIDKTFVLESPTSSENFTFWQTDKAITISEIKAVLPNGSATPTVTLVLYHDTTANGTTNTLVASVAVTNTTTGTNLTISDGTIPANSYVKITTSAQGGTVPQLLLRIKGTED